MRIRVSFGGSRGSVHGFDVAICCPQLAVATPMGPANLTHLDSVSVVLSSSYGVCLCVKASTHSMAHRDPFSCSHLVFQEFCAKFPNTHSLSLTHKTPTLIRCAIKILFV